MGAKNEPSPLPSSRTAANQNNDRRKVILSPFIERKPSSAGGYTVLPNGCNGNLLGPFAEDAFELLGTMLEGVQESWVKLGAGAV